MSKICLLNTKNNEIIESDDIEKVSQENTAFIGIQDGEPQRMLGISHNDLREILNNGSELNAFVRCDSEKQNYLFPAGLNELGDYAKHNLNSECFAVYDPYCGCSVEGAELITKPQPPLDVLTLHLRLDPVAHGSIIPMPKSDEYILVKDGSLYIDDRGKKKRMTAGHVFVCEVGKTVSGDDAISVMVKPYGGEMIKHTLKTVDMKGKPFFDTLANFGVTVDNPRLLSSFLNQQRSILVEFNQRCRLETQLELSFVGLEKNGWNVVDDAPVFKCGNRIIAPEHISERVRLMNKEPSVLRVKGSIEEWQANVFEPIKDNRIILGAIFMALSGVVLEFLPQVRSTILHYSGVSGSGKTSMVQVVASLFGNGNQSSSSRNNDPVYICKHTGTMNGLEAIFKKYSGYSLILDEIGEAQVKSFGSVLYFLSDGQGKQRMTPNTEAADLKVWRLLVISTGEVDIRYLLAKQETVKAGELNRIFEVYLHSNVFGAETQDNGEPTEQEWVKDLLLNTGKYYGSVGAAFIEALLNHDNTQDTVQRYFEIAHQRIAHPLKRGEAVIMGNVCAAEVAARIAMEAGILPISESELVATIDRLATDAVNSIRQSACVMLDFVRKAFEQGKVGWNPRANGAYDVYVIPNNKKRYGDNIEKLLTIRKEAFDTAFSDSKLTIIRRELFERNILRKTNGDHYQTVENGKDVYAFTYNDQLKKMLTNSEEFWVQFEAIAFADTDPFKASKKTINIFEDEDENEAA